MKLLQWNVQWCRGIDGRVDVTRIAAEARRLGDPDVLCLQEIATNFPELPASSGEDQAQALRRELPEHAGCFVSAVDVPGTRGARSRFGNLVLSRFPVGCVLRHSLPWPPAAEVPSMPRVAIEAVIEAPFGPLRIITTHLEYYSDAQRAAQIERLRELHVEACTKRFFVSEAGPFRSYPRPPSAILCGDFNLRPGDRLHARIMENFSSKDSPRFVDAWQALHPREPHPPTFRLHERENSESPYCCDFVFVTEDLVPRLRAIRVDALTRASDHQPVILELV